MTPSILLILSLFVLMSIVSSEVTTFTIEEYGITNVEKERLVYKWTINNFRVFPQMTGEHIISPTFRAESMDVEWFLRLYPRGLFNDPSGSTYISVVLVPRVHEDNRKPLKVHAELALLKSNYVHVNETFDHTYEGPRGHAIHRFILRSTLLNLTSLDDSFTISAKVDMPLKIITEPFEMTDPMEEKISRNLEKNRLNDNFGLLLHEKKFSDVTILVGKDKFQAHKLVLSARSSVFKSMFEENRTSRVRIEKIEPMIMEATLEFIYTDDIAYMKPLVNGLLAAADRFELPRLKAMCEGVLYESLNKHNALNILVLTDLHHSYQLKERVIEFIEDNLSVVKNTEGYSDMQDRYPELLKELRDSVGRGNSQNSLCKSLPE